jgi:hydrogenase maturation protease
VAAGPAAPPVLVLACGALDRSDDAAGLLAARALRARLAAAGRAGDAEIEEVGDLSVDDLTERPGGQRIVIVDAAVGPAPGEIVRVPFDALPASRARPRSSHELPIPEMLGLAALLAGRPPAGELVAIGMRSAAFGDGLTPAVEAAMPRFVDAIVAAVEEAGSGRAAESPLARRAGAARVRRTALPASPRRRATRWRRPLRARP